MITRVQLHVIEPRCVGFQPFVVGQPLRIEQPFVFLVGPAPDADADARRLHDHFRFSPANGSVRMRFPVAAKIALQTAGAAAGSPGSPKPVGAAVDLMKCTSTARGALAMRNWGYASKFVSAAAPRRIVIV